MESSDQMNHNLFEFFLYKSYLQPKTEKKLNLVFDTLINITCTFENNLINVKH